EVEKSFYVSPFNAVHGRYRLRVPEPDEDLRFDIVLDDPSGHRLVATSRGVRRPADTKTILRSQLSTPLVTWMGIARIRVHGIRRCLSRLPVILKPGEPGPAMDRICNGI